MDPIGAGIYSPIRREKKASSREELTAGGDGELYDEFEM
jgi:hypothetical protein